MDYLLGGGGGLWGWIKRKMPIVWKNVKIGIMVMGLLTRAFASIVWDLVCMIFSWFCNAKRDYWLYFSQSWRIFKFAKTKKFYFQKEEGMKNWVEAYAVRYEWNS